MKNRNLLLIIILFFTISANAQRFKGGILVGINASQIDGDTWAGFYKGGLLAGAFVNTDLQEKFGAQFEIKYSAKGAAPHKDSPDLRKIRLNYIDIPVLGTYKAIDNLKIEAGLSFNYLFKGEGYDASGWNNLDPQPNNMETALVAGINYTFFSRFDLNIRWNYSLFPVLAKHSGSTFGEGAWYNHVINFALYFHLGQTTD